MAECVEKYKGSVLIEGQGGQKKKKKVLGSCDRAS